jgi:hypothetical protein
MKNSCTVRYGPWSFIPWHSRTTEEVWWNRTRYFVCNMVNVRETESPLGSMLQCWIIWIRWCCFNVCCRRAVQCPCPVCGQYSAQRLDPLQTSRGQQTTVFSQPEVSRWDTHTQTDTLVSRWDIHTHTETLLFRVPQNTRSIKHNTLTPSTCLRPFYQGLNLVCFITPRPWSRMKDAESSDLVLPGVFQNSTTKATENPR